MKVSGQTLRFFAAGAGLLGLIGTIKVFTGSTPAPQLNEELRKHYRIYSVDIPANLNFAGEPVPLSDFDVRERLDRELVVNTYWQSQTLLLMKRANRWFPVIEPILRQKGVPDDFKYLAVAESGLTNAISPAGATGFWQLLQGTANQYGLETDADVDERYHVEKATEAACNYLLEAKKKFGSWTLAAASYNMGITGISRQMERQKEQDYYSLLLNEETSRYLPRIIALKVLFTQPTAYGYHLQKRHLYPPLPVETIQVDSSVTDFAVFARSRGFNYKLLKMLNPWLRDNYLENPDKKRYDLKIPGKGFERIYESMEQSGEIRSFVPDSIK